MGVAFLIEDGVGVVQMDENAPRIPDELQLIEETAGAGNRQVAHLPRRLAAALHLRQLVVGPECAVKERQMTFADAPLPVFAAAGQARGIEKALLALHELKGDDGLVFG